MRQDILRRIEALETKRRTAEVPKTGPALTAFYAAADFAAGIYDRHEESRESRASKFAWFCGLSGSNALRPFINGGVRDIEELARLDLEAGHADRWHEAWSERLDEADRRASTAYGPDWRAKLSEVINPA